MSLVASYFQPGTTNPFSFLTGSREGYDGGTSFTSAQSVVSELTLANGTYALTLTNQKLTVYDGSKLIISIPIKFLKIEGNRIMIDGTLYVDPGYKMCGQYFRYGSDGAYLTSYGDMVMYESFGGFGLAKVINFSLARYALQQIGRVPLSTGTPAAWANYVGGTTGDTPLAAGSYLQPWDGTIKSGLWTKINHAGCNFQSVSMQFTGGTASAYYVNNLGNTSVKEVVLIWDLKTLLGYDRLIPAPGYMVLTATKLVLSKDPAGDQVVHTVGSGFMGAANMCLGANGDLLIVDSSQNVLWSLYVEACTRINKPAAGSEPTTGSLTAIQNAYKSANAAYSNITALYTKLKAYDKQVADLVPKVKISDIAGSLAAKDTATKVHDNVNDSLVVLYTSSNVNYTSNISIIENAKLGDFSPADQVVAKKIQDSAKVANVTMITAMHKSDFTWNSKSKPMSLRSNINANKDTINTKVTEISNVVKPIVTKLKSLFDTNSGTLRTSPFKTNKFQNENVQSLAAQYSNVVSVRSSLAAKQPAVTILSNTLAISSAVYGSNNVTGYLGYLAKDSDSKFKFPVGVFSNLNGIFGLKSNLPLTVSYTINGVAQNKTFTVEPVDLGKSINIDCVIGWSPCTNADPLATAGTQTYGVKTQPFGSGAACSTFSASNTRACVMPVVNCTGSFGAATECVGGVQSRIYSIVTNRSGGGLECPYPNAFVETSNCKPTVDCVGGWSGWGDCDPTSSTQVATYSVVTEASGAGKACPATDGQSKTRACKPDQPAQNEEDEEAPPAATEKSFFEQYGLILGGGCCCIFLLLIFFFMMKKKA
jgi:hypothetical protein